MKQEPYNVSSVVLALVVQMKNLEENRNHPSPLDRNRAILLARDLLNLNDWVILAIKQSKEPGRLIPGDAKELISFAVMGPGQKLLMDMLVKPDGAVSNDLLRVHGARANQVFNAPSFRDIYKIIQAGFKRTRVLTFNTERIKRLLDQLTKQEKFENLNADFVDLGQEYSRYLGVQSEEKQNPARSVPAYKGVQIPAGFDSSKPRVSAVNECKYLFSLLHAMAGSSQSLDSALTFNKNWSAAFYKPKVGPTEMIREILGISE